MPEIQDAVRNVERAEFDRVYIYVSDALRWDFLEHKIEALGTCFKTVAPSTHSPASFASLLTGDYPWTHGVYEFQNRLSSPWGKMEDSFADQSFLNSIYALSGDSTNDSDDPIFDTLNVTKTGEIKRFPLDYGEILVERGPGGHLPYGKFNGSSRDYIIQSSDKTQAQIVDDYRTKVQRDAMFFQQRLRDLRQSKCAENTLIVFTSDHGEQLGENGFYGHNGPMTPELVYVPTVFINQDIPRIKIESEFIRLIDLIPTILKFQGETIENRFDGQAIGQALKNEFAYSIYKNSYDIPVLDKINLSYSGIWNSDGGIVQTNSRRTERLLVHFGQLLKSPKRELLRQQPVKASRNILKDLSKYGNPNLSLEDAEHKLKSIEHEESTTDVEVSKEQLRDLGYLK